MKNTLFRLTIFVAALSSVSAAYGETSDWYVAPAIVYTDDDSDRDIDDSVAGGQIRFGRALNEHLSVEGLLGYSNIDGVYSAEKHLDFSANLLTYFDRDRAFAPYVMFGIGYLGVDYETSGDENRATGSLGLGFNWRMGQSNFSIRGEYRARLAYEKNDNLLDNISMIGVQFNFGGDKPEPAGPLNTDSDGDGVSERDGDGDGDRIGDKTDQCPNTPMGVPVDRVGCSLDSDGDGVTTDKDRCPGSRIGAVVDMYGCARDDDGDGVPNHLDRCPNTKAGVRTDFNGCEFKDIIRLPGVNFETGIDRLLLGTESILVNAAATLKKHSDLQIEVAGHTDSVGQGDANYGLSERRAKTVRDYLIRYGVAADRLTARGYGESQPISDNDTAQGRAANRRVELRIVNR